MEICSTPEMQWVHYLLCTLTETPENRHYVKPHFIDEEGEASRDDIFFPRSPRQSELNWSSTPGLFASKGMTSVKHNGLTGWTSTKLEHICTPSPSPPRAWCSVKPNREVRVWEKFTLPVNWHGINELPLASENEPSNLCITLSEQNS